MTPQGEILDCNEAMVELLGFPDRQSLARRNAFDLPVDSSESNRWRQVLESDDLVRNHELQITRCDGSPIWVQVSSRCVRDAEDRPVYYEGAFGDISEQKRREDKEKEAVKEKEVLLKEVHHRVKNNLQIVSSLLNLQSAYLRNEYDRELFRESQNRVKAMALLHEKLYQSDHLDRIDFGEYLHSLVSTLFQSYRPTVGTVRYTLDVDTIPLDIDEAIPCGLIAGELFSNALKHAFPNGRAGSVEISFKRSAPSELRLSVSDDGIGMKYDFKEEQGGPLGLQLVKSLAGQLGGVLVDIHKGAGTTIALSFKEPSRSNRTSLHGNRPNPRR